jgi:hypothetical protein
VNPFLVAAIYVVASLVVIPVGFEVFKTRYRFSDVVLAAFAGGAASLIPSFGAVASYVVTVGVLYWRVHDDLFPDILFSVGAARLAMVPVLMAFSGESVTLE